MKLKAAVRYYLNDFKRPVIIYYGVLMTLFVLQLVISALLKVRNPSSGGMEFATTIFLFVVGLNAFKAPFRLFLQNGLSRKTLYVGVVASLCLLAAATTLLTLPSAGSAACLSATPPRTWTVSAACTGGGKN